MAEMEPIIIDNTAEPPIMKFQVELWSNNRKKQIFSNKPNKTIFGAPANNNVTGNIDPS
jgi:hypothetical protein